MQLKKTSKRNIIYLLVLITLLVAAVIISSCQDQGGEGDSATTGQTDSGEAGAGLSEEAQAIAAARGLTPADVAAALKTYTPSGVHDEYFMFSSGGHAGQIYVIGLPSMRILKTIGVFTPEPWQGYGYGELGTMQLMADGAMDENSPLTWGDTHHPALSETGGEYDGEFVFINDKANARIAVVDLRDFETKQILKNPIAVNDHGGTMAPRTRNGSLKAGSTPLP